MSNAILVVDDSELDHILTRRNIHKHFPDVIIHQASDGEEALQKLSSLTDMPKLILLDINMPGMDGFEMLEELQKQEFSLAAVVMLSSSNNPRDQEQAFKYSFVKDYIVKPLEKDTVLSLGKYIS
jgi:CheY-like chemotaxis protein